MSSLAPSFAKSAGVGVPGQSLIDATLFLTRMYTVFLSLSSQTTVKHRSVDMIFPMGVPIDAVALVNTAALPSSRVSTSPSVWTDADSISEGSTLLKR